MEMRDGRNVYSNPDNRNDLKEYAFGFSLSPNTAMRLEGTASIADTNTVILTGNDTSWSANAAITLTPNDLIPFFPLCLESLCRLAYFQTKFNQHNSLFDRILATRRDLLPAR